MDIKQQFTTVTRFSKLLALLLLVSLPFIGFYFGMKFQESIVRDTGSIVITPTTLEVSPTPAFVLPVTLQTITPLPLVVQSTEEILKCKSSYNSGLENIDNCYKDCCEKSGPEKVQCQNICYRIN